MQKPTLLQRALGREPRENAFREVHNLLASSTDPLSVSRRDVDAVLERSGVDVRTEFRGRLFESFSAAVGEALESNGGQRPLELAAVRGLADALGLSEEQADRSVQGAARDVYRRLVTTALESSSFRFEGAPPCLTAAENLTLAKEVARQVYNEVAQDMLRAVVDEAVQDERLSPHEESNLAAAAERLGLDLDFDTPTRRVLERMKLFWRIEEGDPPTVDPGIHLQKNEVCYATREAVWHEHRKVTKRVRYAGPTARIRIAKGIYFRAGDIAVQRVSQDVMQEIDRGRLFLTSKRLLFMGARKNSTIRLTKVLDFTPYSNGVHLEKGAGKSPFLEFGFDVDIFCMYLDRALRDARS